MTSANQPAREPAPTLLCEGSPPTRYQPRCHLIEAPDTAASRALTFERDRITIGAGEDNDLVLRDPTVSRRHCVIDFDGGGYLFRDLGSKNGSRINGVRVGEARLRTGCAIMLGRTRLRFLAEASAAGPSPRLEGLGGAIGAHPKMREVFALIERVAPGDCTILLMGETGTGKEVVAREIHARSSRAGGPFLIFDCPAASANLVEVELFGCEKGSFTGATMARPGLFETARGGTLMLDEVGALPIDLQCKLLRVLDAREARRVGSHRPRAIDARVIATTNRDLPIEVREGRFRADLYYRLAVVQVRLPPLRERRSDIPLLCRHLLHALPAPCATQISDEAVAALTARDWPGNVRELANVLARAIVICEGDRIEMAHLPPPAPFEAPVGSPPLAGPFKGAKERLVMTMERTYLAALLARHGGNLSCAAKEAEVDRRHLRRLVIKHGLSGGGARVDGSGGDL